MRNEEESHPLITTSSSRCDDEETIMSMPTISTTPPPYTDDRATPRPQISNPNSFNPPHPFNAPIFTPPTSTTRSDADNRPIINLYTPSVDSDAIQDLVTKYRESGDRAPIVNVHVRSEEDVELACGNGLEIEGMRKDRRKKANNRACIEALAIVCGSVIAVLAMVMIGFIVWAVNHH